MNRTVLAGGLAAVLLSTTPLSAQQAWGDIKGRVAVPVKDPIPNPVVIDVGDNADRAHCLSRGPLVSNRLLVDAKSRGVLNVMVWLTAIPPGGVRPQKPI